MASQVIEQVNDPPGKSIISCDQIVVLARLLPLGEQM
jgi:hypothetical protein